MTETVLAVIETPLPEASPVLGGTLIVTGWAVATSGIARLTLTCDGQPVRDTQAGTTRSDVGEAFPECADANRAGFFSVLDVGPLGFGPHVLELSAHTTRGASARWQREFVKSDPDQAYRRWIARQGQRIPPGRSDALFGVIVQVSSAEAAAGLWETLRSLDGQVAVRVDLVVCWQLDAPAPLRASADRPFAMRITHVVRTAEDALAAAAGTGLCLLRGGDRLAPDALAIAAATFDDHPGCDLLYADHDRLQRDGRSSPVFKPGWSPLLFEQFDFIGDAWFARREAYLRVGRLGDGASPAGELPLQRLARASATVAHLPRVVVSLAAEPDAGLRLGRLEAAAATSPAQASDALVSIIIPSCIGHPEILARCLDGLFDRTSHHRLEVIVVLNNLPDRTQAEQFFHPWPQVVLMWGEGPFNWAALNNAGAARAQGDYLLFLNDDIDPLDPGWLGALLALASRPDVGVVGAVLRYPNGRIQHAGIRIEERAGRVEPRHTFRLMTGDEPEIRHFVACDREQSAVTGACMLSSRASFDAARGFDEQFEIVFNDVDYCLRLAALGKISVVAAAATLTHHESISRVGMPEHADVRRFFARWAGVLPESDPFHNPNLERHGDSWLPEFGAESPALPRCPQRGVGPA